VANIGREPSGRTRASFSLQRSSELDLAPVPEITAPVLADGLVLGVDLTNVQVPDLQIQRFPLIVLTAPAFLHLLGAASAVKLLWETTKNPNPAIIIARTLLRDSPTRGMLSPSLED